VLDGLDRQVDVEIGPVEMLLRWYLNVEKVIDGKFLVRVPPETHRRLAIEAAEV